MASEWFYTCKGDKRGPVSSQELRRLARNGDLLPTDLLWKAGMKEWVPASAAQNLLPKRSDAPEVPEPPAHTHDGRASADAEVSPQKESIASTVKHYARVARLSTEKTRLTTVSLPAAYLSLGTSLHSSRLHATHFTEIYKEIDQLDGQIHEAKVRSADSGNRATLSEKAKLLARRAKEIAKEKALEMQKLAALARLGQAAASRDAAITLPAELIADIAAIRVRVAAIDAECAAISEAKNSTSVKPSDRSKTQTGTRRLRVFAFVSLASILFVFALLFRPYGREDGSRRIANGTASRESATDTRLPKIATDVAAGTHAISAALPSLGNRLTQLSRTPQRQDRSAEASDSADSGQADSVEEPPVEKKPTEGQMQMAESALRDLNQEQILLPTTSGGQLGLLPPIPRIKPVVPTYTKPVSTHDTGDDAITNLAIDATSTVCTINDTLFKLPSLSALSFDVSVDKLSRLTVVRSVEMSAGQYAAFERNERMKALAAQVSDMARKGRVSGDASVRLGENSVAVIQQNRGLLTVDERTAIPAVIFWRAENEGLDLVDAVPLGITRNAQHGSRGWVIDASAWNDCLVMLTGNDYGAKTGDLLEVWRPSGVVGTMQLTKQITQARVDHPYCMSVCQETGVAAALYENAIRFIDLNAITKAQMPLTECANAVFENPSPFMNYDEYRILWANEGKYCVVQRNLSNPAVGESVVVEVYDANAKLINRLDKSRAAYLGDVSPDGKRVAVRRSYQPKEGIACAFVEPQEVEVLSIPDLKSFGKVYTCFAKQVRLLTDNSLLTSGIAAESRAGARTGGWSDQQMNQIVGANYVTVWDVESGSPLRRIRDVDVHMLAASADGKVVVTTRRSLGNSGATACAWVLDREADESQWVDEFASLRRLALDQERERRSRITLPAPPVERESMEKLRDGMSYYEVKEILGGAGKLSAKVEVDGAEPVLVAAVLYELSGEQKAMYRLTFKCVARRGNQKMENEVKLVRKERID